MNYAISMQQRILQDNLHLRYKRLDGMSRKKGADYFAIEKSLSASIFGVDKKNAVTYKCEEKYGMKKDERNSRIKGFFLKNTCK